MVSGDDNGGVVVNAQALHLPQIAVDDLKADAHGNGIIVDVGRRIPILVVDHIMTAAQVNIAENLFAGQGKIPGRHRLVNAFHVQRVGVFGLGFQNDVCVGIRADVAHNPLQRKRQAAVQRHEHHVARDGELPPGRNGRGLQGRNHIGDIIRQMHLVAVPVVGLCIKVDFVALVMQLFERGLALKRRILIVQTAHRAGIGLVGQHPCNRRICMTEQRNMILKPGKSGQLIVNLRRLPVGLLRKHSVKAVNDKHNDIAGIGNRGQIFVGHNLRNRFGIRLLHPFVFGDENLIVGESDKHGVYNLGSDHHHTEQNADEPDGVALFEERGADSKPFHHNPYDGIAYYGSHGNFVALHIVAGQRAQPHVEIGSLQKEQKCGCDHNRINKAINPIGQEKQNCRDCQRAREPEHQAIGQKIRKGKQKFVEIAAVNFKRRLHTDDHGQRKRRQQNGQNTIFSRS